MIAIDWLTKLLEDSGSDVRWIAIDILSKIGSEAVIDGLINFIKHSDNHTSGSVEDAFNKADSKTVIYGLIKYLKDSNSYFYINEADTLNKIDSITVIDGLIKLLKDSNDNVRKSAVIVLGEIRPETAIPRLIQLLKDSDKNVRNIAVDALGKNGSKTAIPGLIQLLEDTNKDVRCSAIEVMGRIGSEIVIPRLIQLLGDPDVYARCSAVNVLGKIGSETSIPALIPLLEDSDKNVCLRAVDALGKIGSETAIPQLIPLLEGSNSSLRCSAVNVLGKICSETAISQLIPLLEDSDKNVSESALGALQKIGSEAAIPGLIQLLEDSPSHAPDKASEALKKIGSEGTIIELTKKLQNDTDFKFKRSLSKTIDTIQTIQQRLQYYKPTPKILMSKTLSHNYALLIGVGDCKYSNWSLPVTVKDVQAIKSFLTNSDFCGYIDDENYLRLLCNEQATKQNILDNLNWLQEQAKNDPEATILVYYSGHGWLDKSTKNYYLIPHDISPVKPQKTALPATEFNNALRQISAQKLLVIIDSCHAQGMATAKETEELELPENFSQTALPKNLIDDLKQGAGRAIFTSSTGDESSYIRLDQKMSIYTYHFLEALQGGNNKPGDKFVTVSNLMNYVSKTVPQTAQQLGKKQTPIFDFSQTEDFPVALLRGGKGLPGGGWEEIKSEVQENIRNIIKVERGNAAGRDVKNQVYIEKLGEANFS